MRIMIVLIILLVLLFLIGYIQWKQHSVKDACNPVVLEKSPNAPVVIAQPKNDNYIEPPVVDEPEPIVVACTPTTDQDQLYEYARQYANSIMNKFQIDHAHRDIFKTIYMFLSQSNQEQRHECDLYYALFVGCGSLSVSKKLDLGTVIIWKSNNQQQIDGVYEMIMTIAADSQENPKVRANALEILMRSNNRIYMERSKRIMEKLQEHERTQEIEQIRRRMGRIQEVIQQRTVPASLTLPIQTRRLMTTATTPQEEIQIQQALLDQYRRLERRAFNAAVQHKATVYDDTQNVHNRKINESVIQSAQNILKMTSTPSPMVDVEKQLEQYYPDYQKNKEKIKNSMNRIRSDPSKFKGETTISQVFDKVVGIISNSRHKQEMWRRLGEEMTEMNQLCATGHLSRLVNVVQGFEDVPADIQIKMDPKDEIYANISNYLTMQIQNSGEQEQLLASMIDPENRQLFLEFVCLVLQPKMEELQKEYQGVSDPTTIQTCIHGAIRTYIKNDKDTETILKMMNTATK